MPLPISLVCITRNSGPRLKQLIDNHRDVVSEVVVIDQGSTDGTFEVAKEHADFVFRKRRKGTADPDRNWAFALAKHDYVLYLDDDERLSDEAKKLLPKILATKADIFWFKRENYVDGISIEEILGDDIQCRLFKKGSVKFPSRIHQHPEGAMHSKVFYLDTSIVHERTLEQVERSNKGREVIANDKERKLQDDFIHDVKLLLKEKDGFSENWYSNEQIKNLVETVSKVKDLEGEVVEIGCWEGKSTCALANAVYPTMVHAVDTWQGNTAEGEDHPSVVKAKKRDVYSAFLKNVNTRTKSNVSPWKEDCFAWLARMRNPDQEFKAKFFHIDAAHDYESVKKTVAMAKGHLVKGGILCGDDFLSANALRDDLNGGVERAVREMCPGVKNEGNFWYWVNK